MDPTRTSSPDAPSTDAAVSLPTSTEPVKRIGWAECHLPEVVDSLDPRHPETAFTETRRLRQDGWTPERKRQFLERIAECGVVKEACLAAGMSARAAYNLRDRDPLFAAGWDAAFVMARSRLADEAFSRSMNGVVERIYKDGAIVAERHRYDNRLTMAVLARLDSRVDRAEDRCEPHLALVPRWDDYLDALSDDRRDDGLALLEPAPGSGLQDSAPGRELCELHHGEEGDMADLPMHDGHDVWESRGRWWTDYPPPPGFDGEEGETRLGGYCRTLSPAEQAVVDDELAAERAVAEALRDAYFGFVPEPADSVADRQSGEAD
ncbi:MAG: hypothetical protein JWL74_1464 [Alphaproteobacteria bacterium]|nr:hypothetical protein [Alphaproteobacteria bacterium]